jgi:hypothetical protein
VENMPEQPPQGARSSDALLDDAARMILSMPGYDIEDESDRKRLRVQLAAMFPRDKEYLANLAIERALQLAAGTDPPSS